MDVPHRRVAADDRPVGVEQHQVVEVVDVVAVVQGRAAAGRHDVARQAPQRRRVLVADVVLHRRVGRPGAAVLGEDVVAEVGVDLAGRRGEAVAEGGAVRAADGVRAGEDDQLLGGEALGGEVADELGDVERGAREVVLGVRGRRDDAVQAAGRDGVVDAAVAEVPRRVAGREREDVGAGDGAGAGALEVGLDGVDHVEASETDVGARRLLRIGHRVRRIQKDRTIAALHVYKRMNICV